MDFYSDSDASLIFSPTASTIKEAFGFTLSSTTLLWYRNHVAEAITIREARVYQRGRTPSRTFVEQLLVLCESNRTHPLGYVFCRHSAEQWVQAKKDREIIQVNRCEAGDPLWAKVSRIPAPRVDSQHERLQMLVQRRIDGEGQPARA
jgi:hypothetical protein